MIAIDSSAIVAIALLEPEARAFGEIIGSEPCVIGTPTLLKCHMVLSEIPRRRGLALLDQVMKAPRLRVVGFGTELLDIARSAFDQFGRGRHRDRLNFGDCMAYAVAKHFDLPLLFKGTDFALTDVRPALP